MTQNISYTLLMVLSGASCSPDGSPSSTMKLDTDPAEVPHPESPCSSPTAEEHEDPVKAYEGGCPGSAQTKYDVYTFMEDPDTLLSHAFSAFIMGVIVLSVITMVVESLPQYAHNPDGEINKEAEAVFFKLEAVFIAIFTAEFLTRFYCVPEKCRMLAQPMNIVDVLAIAPFYITLILAAIVDTSQLKILRLLRIIRVFRVLKLAKYNRSLAVAIQALTDSTDMFGLMIFMLVVLCILFASFAYNFEMDETESPTRFESIPAAMWWCIVTVMMVGYGDMFPTTVAGKLVASGCIVVGILIMALPISVIGSNFSRTWEKYEAKVREEQKLLEAQKVLTNEEILAIETRKYDEVIKIKDETTSHLTKFGVCCDQQMKKISETENEVFDKARDIWIKFAVDAKKLNMTPGLELWRERQVKDIVKEEQALMATLAEDCSVLTKVLDAELDEQLEKAIDNAKWMRLLLVKYKLLADDVRHLAAHLGQHSEMIFPELMPALENLERKEEEANQAEVERQRTPSPPHRGPRDNSL